MTLHKLGKPSSTYGFDIGGFSKAPAEDEKILGSVDWNITDSHRAKFTYISTEGNTIREQNGNNFLASENRLGASSAWYDRSEDRASLATCFLTGQQTSLPS